MNLFFGEYIENENGQKFYLSGKSDGDGVTEINRNINEINFFRTFDITIYDATSLLTIHLPTNAGKEIVIELEISN